jgi:hypothetical protein
MLQALEMEDADMFNQRMLFELLKASRGSVDMFRTLLDSSDFLEEKMEMLREILDEYHEPKFEDLAAAKGIDLSQAAPAITAQPEDASDTEPAGESEDDEDEINFDDYEEDDDDFFTSGTSAGSTFAPTPTVVKDKIKAALANW